jgi:outer membrane protein W
VRALLLATLLVFASGHVAIADDDENPLAKKPAAAKPAKAKAKPKAKPAKTYPKKKAAPKKKEPEPEIEMEPDPPPAPVVVVEPPKPEPVVAVKVVVKPAAQPYKKLYLRAGIVHVAPLEQSRELELADVDGPASLAVQNGPIAGSGSSISSATVPGLIIGYRIRPRWALETVLGIPFTVKFKATGTLRDMSIAPTALGIPTGVPAIGEELGEAKAAPPTLTAVYDLTQGRVRPYAGAGIAVLFAYGGKLTNPILTEVSQPAMKISPAPGLVLQTGIEAKITNRIYARADIKFIALMLARARVEHVEVRAPTLPLFDTVEVGTAKMNVWVNPLIIQLGVGTDF